MTARLRLIAGPNGSGKTTLTNSIREKLGEKFGIYVNADDMERSLREHLTLDLSGYGIAVTPEDFRHFFNAHALRNKAEAEWKMLGTLLTLLQPLPDLSYFPILLADFIRERLLAGGASFTLETVMSDAGKVDLLRRAQRQGYRTYLYYVCVEDPLVNVDRVADRVSNAGHGVPTEKILDRYRRSLENAVHALPYTNRAYFWDNSGTRHRYVAEVTDASIVNIVTDDIPYWLQEYILDKF